MVKQKTCDFLLIILILRQPNASNGSRCGTLYSGDKQEGNKLELEAGDRLDDLRVGKGWDTTSTLTVEESCTLEICDEARFAGSCQKFEYGSHSVSVDGAGSLECNCSEFLERCKCSRFFIKKSLCARAFLKGGCRECRAKHVDIRPETTSFPEAFMDKVESLILRKGCSLTVYSEPDLMGKMETVSEEILEDYRGTIGSYECSCNNNQYQQRTRPERPHSYPDPMNIPTSFDEILRMLNTKKYGSHDGLHASYETFKRGRSLKNAYILLLGSSGAGKSSTVNTLFDNPDLTGEGDSSSTTSEIFEFRVPVPIDELGIANSELRVIDTPGLGDTRGMIHDAQFLASLDHYLSSHQELKDRIPNVVLIFHKLDDNRFSGEGSNFVKMLKGLDSLKGRITDDKFSNVIFVLTHFCSMSKATQKRSVERLLKFKKTFEEFTLFPKPIQIVVAENKGYDEELSMLNGYWELPNGDLYPRNLFEKLELVIEYAGDFIGLGVFRTAFRNSDGFKVTQKSFEMVDRDHKKIPYYLDILNSANMVIEQTEISVVLRKIWESDISADLKKKFPHSLAYLQKLLNLRNINSERDIPRTNAEIMKLLADIKQDPATRQLLQKGLGISTPVLAEFTMAGYGYDVFNDRPLHASPFEMNRLQQSDIGFLIPDYLSCTLKPETSDMFLVFDNKTSYVGHRMKDLGIQVEGQIPLDEFISGTKPGHNIENLVFNSNTCKATAVRNFKLFELKLIPNSKLTEEFKIAVKSLKPLDESDQENVESWKRFFVKYGTHVVSSAYGGGSIEIQAESEGNPCQKEDIYALLGILKFLEDVPLAFSYEKGIPEGQILPKVISHSLKFTGGDYKFYTGKLSKMQVSQFSKLLGDWRESLRFNPAMLGSEVTLLPISHVVKDLVGNYASEIERATSMLFKSKLKYIPPVKQADNTALAREDTPYINSSKIQKYIEQIIEKVVLPWLISILV